jgi:hypothetical protein
MSAMPQEKKTTYSLTAAIERSIDKGLSASEHDGAPVRELSLFFSVTQQKTLEDLTNLLGVAERLMVNAAIRYALSYAHAKSLSVNDLPNYPKRLGKLERRYPLTAESYAKLKEAENLEEAGRIALTGLKLFKRKLALPKK